MRKILLKLAGSILCAAIVYAGCVHWPFHWNPAIGMGLGILILGFGIGDAMRGLRGP